MELWIRSQDKERLEKSTGFHIVVASKNEVDIVNSYMTIMGRYKTKERALEVLDEIKQALLDNNIPYTGAVISFNNKIIYEMPEE